MWPLRIRSRDSWWIRATATGMTMSTRRSLNVVYRGARPCARMSALPARLPSLSITTLVLLVPVAANAQQTPYELDRIVVVGRSSLSEDATGPDDLPYTVSALTDADLAADGRNLAQRLADDLPGMQSSDIQGNPNLMDLRYRGFEASSLLGSAQGLSVYLDGVRVNEPFGDIVHWDLVPSFALRRVELHGSASPNFGLNTLGGAIALRTHDGRTRPGLRIETGAGSFGTYLADASVGGAAGAWDAYATAGAFGDDGWRDHSGSSNRHLLVKLGHEHDTTRWEASLLHARSDLTGNGLVPAYSREADGSVEPDLYGRNRAAVYTYPDNVLQDATRSEFEQVTQPATFTPDRGTVAIEDGVMTDAMLDGRASTWGAYANGTWRITATTHLTGALRFVHSSVRNRLLVVDDDTGDLRHQDERFLFSAVNPALGVTYARSSFIWFANASRNTRNPTAIELGCADPAEPCRLPAGLQSDPYLHPVVSRAIEAGVRAPRGAVVDYGLTAYRTDNRHDILFQSVGFGQQRGYFRNVPATRRQGIDAHLGWTGGHGRVQLDYSFLDATYRAQAVLRQGERDVHVVVGTPIAGLSRHSLKLGAEWRPDAGWAVTTDLQAFSRRRALGAEDDRSAASPGFATLGLGIERQIGDSTQGVRLFARLSNVFDRRYETYAAWASTVFSPDGRYEADEREAVFVAPGIPRSFFLGLRIDR